MQDDSVDFLAKAAGGIEAETKLTHPFLLLQLAL
jgi:hypothetical protein